MLNGVIRFFVILLSSLSLVLSPAAAAFAPDASGPDASGVAQTECSMSEAEMDMGMGAGHDKMACCTPQCTAPAAAAVLTSGDSGPDIATEDGTPLRFPRDAMLASVSPAATDPPPRLHLT